MDTSQATEANDPTAAAHQRYIDAIQRGDIEAILTTFWEDAVWMPQNETSLYGIEELREWFEDYFQHFQITAYGETEREVRITGDLAVERSAYMVAITPVKGGDRIRDDGRILSVWTRGDDGEWKVSQSMMNSMRPVGSGTSRFMARMRERKEEESGRR